jgi:hypothetical protein
MMQTQYFESLAEIAISAVAPAADVAALAAEEALPAAYLALGKATEAISA